MMRPSLLLRIAAVLTLLYGAGHTSGYPWTPRETASAADVVTAMKQARFVIMGFDRSFWHFYIGFGLAISVLMVAEAVVLWLLGGLARTDAARLRPLIAVFTVSYALNAALSWMYFFTVPLVFAVAIVVTLLLAFLASKPRAIAPA